MASLEDSVGGGDASADHLLEDDVIHEETEDLIGHDENNGAGDDPELEAIKARVQAMEEEAIKLKELQSQMDLTSPSGGSVPGSSPNTSATGLPTLTNEEKVEVDSRSIYVGNVDYGANAEELEQHFHGCGSIQRVTILCNKFNGSPKGFAYVEFTDKDSVDTAMALDDSLFRGRQIKVLPKRTNKPGISSTNRPPRGRGFRGRMMRGGRGGGFGAMRRPRDWYHLSHGPVLGAGPTHQGLISNHNLSGNVPSFQELTSRQKVLEWSIL